MSNFDDIRSAKERLRIQMAELKQMYGRALQLMESGGKSAVIAYLSKEYCADPIEKGNDVLIGSHLIRFDRDDKFLGIGTDPGQPSIAIKKPPPSSGNPEMPDKPQ